MCSRDNHDNAGKVDSRISELGLTDQKVINNLSRSLKKPTPFSNWIDQEIQSREDKSNIWQWESLIMYHFKVDARELKDDEFFDLCARLKWVIETEQRKNKIGGE